MTVPKDISKTQGVLAHPSGPDDVAVYRFYGQKDELLYIGVSKAPLTRWTDHQLAFWWREVVRFEWAWHPSRKSARAEEKEVLASGVAKYNIHGTPKHGENWRQQRAAQAPGSLTGPDHTDLAAG